jgi:hypothetical protein
LSFLIIPGFTFAQSPPDSGIAEIDSLINILEASTDTLKVNILNKLSKELEYRNPDQ